MNEWMDGGAPLGCLGFAPEHDWLVKINTGYSNESIVQLT